MLVDRKGSCVGDAGNNPHQLEEIEMLTEPSVGKSPRTDRKASGRRQGQGGTDLEAVVAADLLDAGHLGEDGERGQAG